MTEQQQKQTGRFKVIMSTFTELYFGHVATDLAAWGELELYCDNYLAVTRSTTTEGRMLDVQLLQEGLGKVLFGDHPLNVYPVSARHRKRVRKWLLGLLDKHMLSVTWEALKHDEEGEDEEEPEFIFKTFLRGETATVTLLEENRDLIGHGTTGLTSWQGALYLADWMLNHPDIVKGKNVLELGSGTGLLGITLLKTTGVRNYTFTDCNSKLNISTGTALKEDAEEKLERTRFGPPDLVESVVETVNHRVNLPEDNQVAVRYLNWLDFDVSKFGNEFDVILGSDIVYERSLLPALSFVLRSLLSSSSSTAFIACTERSYTTLDCFEASMAAEGLKSSVVHRGLYSPADVVLSSDVPHQPTRLYKIERGEMESVILKGQKNKR